MTSHSPSGTRVAGGLFAPTEEQKNLLAAWTADALDDDGRSAMPYFAHILLALRVLDAPGLGTFAVDPYFRLYVDFEAVQAKGHRWCVESLLHEASHVWLDHFEVYDEVAWLGPVDRMTVNVANDLSLNDDLTQAGCVTFEADGMLPRFIGEPDGQTPHHYYRVLMAKQQAARKARQESGTGQGGTGQSGTGQGGSQSQGADGSGEAGGGQPPQHQDGQPFRGCGSGSGGVAAPCELDESDDFGGLAPAISPLEKEYVHLATAASVQAYQKSRGTVPGGTIERALQVMKPTRTPWQAVLGAHLRRAVTNRRGAGSVTPSKRNRRKHAAVINDARGNRIGKVVHPATVRPAPRVEVIRDTSGSMSASDLMVVGNEIETIARRMGIRGKSLMVTDVDAATHGSVAYTGASSIAGVKGRGGTDMRVGIAEACARPPRERASTIVVITDGYTPWPATPPGVPVVAAIVVGGTVGPDTGTRLLADLPPFVRGVVCDNGLGSP